ncbi:glycosyltransferase [Nocardioides sp. Kera G14]|uniref:glycosyltransferase n=1 Tax=Nocardioides sp. Kera G14 TaxID=2884264 RepID=UPI001D10411C|nr:glycosyltransferase [Nocardioides sp. Kera G14]UDY22675.1 glycosyltransferase [Nocardioides sp. Kera G14]
MKHPTTYIDVTDVTRLGFTSGIQRVAREIVVRLVERADLDIRLIRLDPTLGRFRTLESESFRAWIRDRGVTLADVGEPLSIDDFGPGDVFLDLESPWLSPLTRPALYQGLKGRGARIATVVYDLVPVLMPHVAHQNTVRAWSAYIAAVYAYADLVLPISRTTERDFLDFKAQLGVERHIPTLVMRLGGEIAHAGELTAAEEALVAPLRGETFFLFVGTIEPRKRQLLALEAWEELRSQRPGTHLVFVGRLGWNSDETAKAIREHPQFGTTLHWFEGPSDRVVEHLYRESFATLYLSHYEGYGLPVAESLARGKIVISSRSAGAIHEVAGELADYSFFDAPTEIAATMSLYLSHPELYEARTAAIAESFDLTTWDTTASVVGEAIARWDEPEWSCPETLQFVYISNDPSRVIEGIRAYERHAPVKEFLVACPESMRASVLLPSYTTPVRVVTDEELLGEEMDAFRAADHQGKNWMLRRLLVAHEAVDEVFVMLDDDSRPLRDLTRDDFIHDDGTDSAYFYGDLPRWPRSFNSYDYGQVETLQFVRRCGLEELSYSSHQPQVIRKQVFLEAAALVAERGPGLAVDEWSVYFNYAISRYPSRFRKQPFKTLNWPMLATDWQVQYPPVEYAFENRYDHPYDEGIFSGHPNPSTETKVALKAAEAAPLEETKERFREGLEIVRALGLAKGPLLFEAGDLTVVVQGVPRLLAVSEGVLKLPLSVHLVQRQQLPVRVELAPRSRDIRYPSRAVRVPEQGPLAHDYAYVELPLTIEAHRPVAVLFDVVVNGIIVPATAPAFGAIAVKIPPEESVAGVLMALRPGDRGASIAKAYRASLPKSQSIQKPATGGGAGAAKAEGTQSRTPSRHSARRIARGLARRARRLQQMYPSGTKRELRALQQRLGDVDASIAALRTRSDVRARNQRITARQARASVDQLTRQVVRLSTDLPRPQRATDLTRLNDLLKTVEHYQPLYGLPGLVDVPSRESLDRAHLIEQALGVLPGLRVLDIGSSLGYMCLYLADRGAHTCGWEMNPDNAEVARIVSRLTGVRTTIKTRTLDEHTISSVGADEFDAVLVLSVLHHVIHFRGLEHAQHLVADLLDRARVLIVELAGPNEGEQYYWSAAQPEDPLTVLDLVRERAEIEILGTFGTHLSGKVRPLVKVTRRQVVEVAGHPHAYDAVRTQAYDGSPLVGENDRRRFFFSDTEIIKEYGAERIENQAFKQPLREMNMLLNELSPDMVWHLPELVDFDIVGRRQRLVLKRVPGDLVVDLAPLADEAVRLICEDVLHTLEDLQRLGISHNDLRSWNIVHGDQGAWLIDYGLASHRPVEDDIVALLWALRAAATGEREGFEVDKAELPPRDDLPEAIHPVFDLVESGVRDAAELRAVLHTDRV